MHLKISSLRPGVSKGCPTVQFVLHTVLVVLARAVKLSLFANNSVVCIKKL